MSTGFLFELADHVLEVIGDLAHGLVREHLGMGLASSTVFGIVGPARRERRVAGVFEHRLPAVPTARQ